MHRIITAAVTAAIVAAFAASSAQAETHRLSPSPTTIAWGFYQAGTAPALTINSGDTVVIHTLLTSSPARLESAGLAASDVEPALRAVFEGVPPSERGPGGHILTGPIAIAGAEPGDTLEVRILKIDLAIPYAYNAFRFGAGFLTDDFPYARFKLVPLDARTMTGRFGPGIEVPLAPFFGSMGVAPPPEFGRIDSAPPTIAGGNMDNKHLIAGTTLFLPVHAAGALFQIGDGHAAQGNGEIDITALETSLIGTFAFILHKKGSGISASYPRAETPTHHIAMGFDEDLSNATRKAVRHAIDFLEAERNMTRDDAYMLLSVAGDLEITQLVDRNKGVHMMIPKKLFTTP